MILSDGLSQLPRRPLRSLPRAVDFEAVVIQSVYFQFLELHLLQHFHNLHYHRETDETAVHQRSHFQY